MARVREITYTLDQSIPLQAITGEQRHQYASIRPAAKVTIEFDDQELQLSDPDKVTAALREAFDYAANRCSEQITDTIKEIKRIYSPGGGAAKTT